MFINLKNFLVDYYRNKVNTLRSFLVNDMLNLMATRRVKDVKNMKRFSFSVAYLELDNTGAYLEIKNFYEGLVKTWASGNTRLMENFFISRYLHYRAVKLVFYILTQATILTQIYIAFHYEMSITIITAVFTGLFLLILEFFKFFPENSLRINYPSYNDPDGGYWTDLAVKMKFQKKHILLLNANDISDYDFSEFLQTSSLTAIEKNIAQQLKTDGYLDSVEKLCQTAKLLAI